MHRSGRNQSGHVSTELAPWLVLGGFAGGVMGVFFKVDAGLAVLAGAGVAIAAYIILHVFGGMLVERAVRARARQQLRAWLAPDSASGVIFDHDVWLIDGVFRREEDHAFGGGHTRYHGLGIDTARKRIALASECGTTQLSPGEISRWRQGDFAGKAEHNTCTIDLAVTHEAHKQSAGAAIRCIEINARSNAEAEAVHAALRDVLGAPG